MPLPQHVDENGSWAELVLFQAEVALAYRRQNARLREQLLEKDRAIEMYRKIIADWERQQPRQAAE